MRKDRHYLRQFLRFISVLCLGVMLLSAPTIVFGQSIKAKKIPKIKSKSKNSGGESYQAVGKRKKNKHDSNKVATVKTNRRSWLAEQWVGTVQYFCETCYQPKLQCPDKTARKVDNGDIQVSAHAPAKARIHRFTKTVEFDIVELEDVHLDIPAFKLFKNNMTDFTADGEQEFHHIIQQIAIYLGTNYDGDGVTLKILGSASQIPTSFDPTKPNNNINPDGSSIKGQTSIANNQKLAKARADELAKKIKAVFPSIEIITPKLEEIKIGETAWTKQHQAELSKAFLRGDKAAMDSIYAPFQKDQWVKVESKERTSKTVKPNALKMYMISGSPAFTGTLEDEKVAIRGPVVVSKNTYDALQDHLRFNSVEEREKFLEQKDILFKAVRRPDGSVRWYGIRGMAEIKAFQIQDHKQRTLRLYELGLIDNLDEDIIEQKIIADVHQQHRTARP